MIPEFLQELLHRPEGKLFSSSVDGVYVVAESFAEAQERISDAADAEVFEVLHVRPVRDN